jgi:VanZ family protein
VKTALVAFLPLVLWAAAVITVGSLELGWGGMASLPSGSDKAAHFAMYGVGGVLAVWVRRIRGVRAGTVGLLFVLMVGVIDELHQAGLPTRESDFWDWAADAAGAAVGYLVTRLLAPERE